MIDRRTFVAAMGLAAATGSRAQTSRKLPRVGLLTPGANADMREQAFWQGMRAMGYVDGKTMIVDRRSADGDLSRIPVLADAMVRNRPDVIVAIASASAIAARQSTASIPIVFIGVADPVAAGLAGNLARPGGNVTGTSSQSTAVVGKQVELIRQLVPRAKHVAMLWDPANAVFQQLMLSEGLAAAAKLGIFARILEARHREDIDRAFDALSAERPDAVLLFQDPIIVANADRIAELALLHRLPAFSGARRLVEAGILASYGSDLTVVAQQSAAYVHKILRGAKPADLAIQLPTKFELVINLRTARALAIEVPPTIVTRADEVIR